MVSHMCRNYSILDYGTSRTQRVGTVYEILTKSVLTHLSTLSTKMMQCKNENTISAKCLLKIYIIIRRDVVYVYNSSMWETEAVG